MNGLDPRFPQEAAERRRELGITIHEAELLVGEEAVHRVVHVPTDLTNPSVVWARRHAREVNAPAAQFDGEQDIHRDEIVSTPNLDGREIDGGNCRPVSAQKSAPRCPAAALWGRVDAIPPQEICDRGPGHVMTEIGQGTFNPTITPARVLCGESDNESFDLLHDSRPTWSALWPLIPLGRYELPMPSEDRVGGYKPGQIQERLSPDSLAGDGEPTPLVIREPDPSIAQLPEKDAVLLPQEVDRRLLVTIDPACEC